MRSSPDFFMLLIMHTLMQFSANILMDRKILPHDEMVLMIRPTKVLNFCISIMYVFLIFLSKMTFNELILEFLELENVKKTLGHLTLV